MQHAQQIFIYIMGIVSYKVIPILLPSNHKFQIWGECTTFKFLCARFDPLGQKDPLEEEITTQSSILAWRIPWTGEHGRLWSIGWQRVGHDGSYLACMYARLKLILKTGNRNDFFFFYNS